jgi:peptide/nickel transport system permease protein
LECGLKSINDVLLKCILQLLAGVFIVSTLCFFMLDALPGDAAFRIAASRYGYDLVSIDSAQRVAIELDLHRPKFQRLLSWWGQVVTGNFGKSLVSNASVLTEIIDALFHTLVLAFSAFFASIFSASLIGAFTASNPFGVIDRLSELVAVVFRSIPPFITGVIVIIVFSVNLGFFPAAGSHDASSLVLPALTLSVGLTALLSRVVRTSLLKVMRSEYFEFARLKGLSHRVAFFRHGIKNASIPVLGFIGVQLALLIEGVVLIETLFAWPGLGHEIVHAVYARDVPMLQAACVTLVALFVVLNLAIEILCARLDPSLELSK